MKINPTVEKLSEQQRADRLKDLEIKAELPERHARCTPIIDNAWGDTFSAFKTKLGNGVLLALVGTRGNGKTQLAVSLARWVMEANYRSARYTTAASFFMDVKAAYRPGADESERSVIEEHVKPRFLIIDEFNKRGASEWEGTLMFELLHRRYNALKDTILIDNRTVEEFTATIGPSLASRMNEGGGIVQCDWPSFRA